MRIRLAHWTATVAVASLLTLGGCASVQEMDALEAELAAIKSAVAAAQSTADQATKDSEAAMEEAGRASRTANRGLSAARESQTCCAANSERIDRMFKKSMMK